MKLIATTKKTALLIVCVFCFSIANAQTNYWVKTIGGTTEDILGSIALDSNGNLYLASAALGIHRTTLLRKLRKYKLGFKKNGLF